ncbi:hypothetical protein L6164_030777 [Bauhinia variegata]|uniref:Uncharacterized protein n=1 Tax=Bauhinia variegata TaxID=167791 RepID=A0ACB9LDJ3_BAUVA|nr:hypothetical protein L6164_030777 [Bauhinia variegata]
MDVKTENRSMQDDNGLGWGKSLPVPSVQEMVKNESDTVPERYIRESKDRPVLDRQCQITSEIPAIDFSLLVNRDENEQKKLDFACQKWGFFQLVNHGVAEELLHKMEEVTRTFLELPLVEKNKYAMAENDIQGYRQAYVVSQDQKLDWNDLIFLLTYPPECRNLNYWPLTPPGFKKTVEDYSTEIYRVTGEIYANLSLIEENDTLGRHSDGCAITLLLRDDDITGLQVKHEESWIPVKPLPGVLVFNVGDIVEM